MKRMLAPKFCSTRIINGKLEPEELAALMQFFQGSVK
jgi:hypothetical protein